MTIKQIIINILSEDRQPSSKRTAGFIGFIVCLFLTGVEIVTEAQITPESLTLGYLTSAGLLGLESIVGIFKK